MAPSPHPPTAKDLSGLIAETLSKSPIRTGDNPDLALSNCLSSLRSFTTEASRESLHELEEQIQVFYISHVDQSNAHLVAQFLSILHTLLPAIAPISIITSWFDLTLRPALRTPGLQRNAVNQAKELVIHGLAEYKPDPAKSVEFRRRIIDLYLLDVFSDTSGDDAVEKVMMDSAEQERRRCWKSNLEAILVGDALQQPKEFFGQINEAFSSPPARLQIVVFLSQLTRSSDVAMSEFASSPLFSSLLTSLQVDNSTTLISVGISVLIMMLPKLTVEAPKLLNDSLPRLLAILARVICWRERGSSRILGEEPIGRDGGKPGSIIEAGETKLKPQALIPEVKWNRLESTFDLAAASPPDAHLYFQFLYGLWPCNVLSFLRKPVQYLFGTNQECPYVGGWEESIYEEEVHSKAKPILRSHICHPSIILQDATSELSDLSRWSVEGLNIPGIVSECNALDVRSAAAALPPRRSRSKAPPLDTLPYIPPTSEQIEGTPTVVSKGEENTIGLSTPTAGPGALRFFQDITTGAVVVLDTSTPSRSRSPASTALSREVSSSSTIPNAEAGTQPIREILAKHVLLKSSNIGASDQGSLHTRTDSGDQGYTPSIRSADKEISSLPPTISMTRNESPAYSPSLPPTPRSPNLRPAASPLTLPSPLPLSPPGHASPSPKQRFAPLDLTTVDKQLPSSSSIRSGGAGISTHAEEAIATLQREVLLLRNELNFELWLKKQHLSHMGKLHKDRIVARKDEAERQSLLNKLKNHKIMLAQRTDELKALRSETSVNKTKQNEWIQSLQSKLKSYREEKQSWVKEAVELRGDAMEAKAMVRKQKERLDITETERFNLETQLREVLPKVSRITEYEKTIDSLTQKQLLWDDSPEMRRLREQKVEMDEMVNNYGKMELTIQSLAAANKSLEELLEEQRKKIRMLESKPTPTAPSSHRLSVSSSRSLSGSGSLGHMNPNQMVNALSIAHSRLHNLETEHENVKSKNIDLEERVEELEAMLEVLRVEGGAPRRSVQARDLRAGGLGVC